MQTIFTNIKCREIILSNAIENWYIILYDLFSRLWYIATCGPFCKDGTHIYFLGNIYLIKFQLMYRIFALKTSLSYTYSRIICHKLD